MNCDTEVKHIRIKDRKEREMAHKDFVINWLNEDEEMARWLEQQLPMVTQGFLSSKAG